MARKSKEDAELTRQAILESAGYLFAKNGFAETKISDICERSKHTKGALFHYFPSKEDLFETVWEDMQADIVRVSSKEMSLISSEADDPYAGFIAGCRIFLKHVSRPDYQQIVYIDGPSVLGMKKWMQRDAGMGLRNIGSGLKLLAQENLIDEANRPALTVLIYGALQGLAKTLTLQGTASRTTPDDVFAAFEKFVRSLR